MSPDRLADDYEPNTRLLHLLHLPVELTKVVAALFRICDQQLQLHWGYTLNLLVLLAPRLLCLPADPKLVIVVADGRYLGWSGEVERYDLRTGQRVSPQPYVVTQAVDVGRLYHLGLTHDKDGTGDSLGTA